ncbi:carbohydrate sulfotransferase 1-like isoform X1 [Crassostrea virginica]
MNIVRFILKRTKRSKGLVLGLFLVLTILVLSRNKESDKSILYNHGYGRLLQEWKPEGIKYFDQLTTADGPTPVVILTYMRSGSSFFGEVIQASDDVFYLFEPLRTIQFQLRKNKTFHYLDNKTRNYTHFLEAAADVMNEIFQCNFEKLPLTFFSDGFLNKGKKAREFTVCMNYKRTNNTNRITATKQCALMMKRRCLASKFIVLKTIRIPLRILVSLSGMFQKLRILHLLRDPRATLKSQSRFGIVKTNHLQENATKFCNRVFEDITLARQSPSIGSNRYFPISYENLAKSPKEMSARVYSFLDMDVTANMTMHIEKMTMADRTCGESRIAKTMCTKSANSSADAEKWRQTIPYSFAAVVDSACSMLYSIVGLRSVPDEEHLRNLSFSLRTKTIDDFGDFRYS